MIEERADALVRIAEALLEREVLDGAEVFLLIDGKDLPVINTKPPAAPTGEGEKGMNIRPETRPVPPPLLGGNPQPA